ncbi:MAG: hypothetical protein QOH21_3442 [Acidobacteriota bacterium]|jgi:hypothetical protein|nr:hypothetical protein [Acidobacteriota bacterium]
MQHRLDTEQVLAGLAKIRATMPLHRIRRTAHPPRATTRTDARTTEDFEMEAIADALESLADDARALAAAAIESAVEQALDVYYAAAELARQPEHANLIPHMENMRRAYHEQYGHAIPTKEETERRRAREAVDPVR